MHEMFNMVSANQWTHLQSSIQALNSVLTPQIYFQIFDPTLCYNHVTCSKWADILICHTTMQRNPITIPYNLGHVTLWCVEVGLVANAKEGSTQEHDQARVVEHQLYIIAMNSTAVSHGTCMKWFNTPNMHICFSWLNPIQCTITFWISVKYYFINIVVFFSKH